LRHFFPGQNFPEQEIEEGLEKGEIFTDKQKILPFLQTALFDEKVLEVELDGKPRIYFSRILDDLPDHAEDIEDEEDEIETLSDEDEYSPGDYLTKLNHIVTLPLEPGLGNLHLRYSRFIVLRMFTNTYAVEMGTTFEDLTNVGEIPVLKLSFPELAKISRNTREFRAKVPEVMDFTVLIKMGKKLPTLTTTPLDISVKGMSFSMTQDEQKLFLPDAVHSLQLHLNDELVAGIDGTVKKLSKVRKKDGIEYICEVEFDLITPTLAAVIETTVASVQRAHLKDIAEKSDASGIKLIA
ncbi:MAG: hypothetical protein WBB23_11600, partial [Desulforhopalus sp.]